ncbi:sugar ABC transporter permease [Caldimonas thermodepolymerans]|jgi:ABC-type sugar transport systems, permease components|uniref:Sugar ABC transporter permease n=1 Tax=Caldimonas thermodepolymerans TaxID=215580 RepID=A0A2S5T520_9BURK|nr:sugar ABC transporter permease [Caldimonas thermodepolymerans]PPE70046.1 sugar ABC transporter permease [Caldimonas thermodepolymerans]QPC31787.1 sugar ABC transporter permease [Caldimonas thermodepolymerans]RDI01708.1 carbohydrate ABC transporter membrane protein 1 (CUT1 family) [Caldimonas thermodepolymerans]UZG44571.1 sugar ABC transporter permease [Caldimonas thermodepolymerans]
MRARLPTLLRRWTVYTALLPLAATVLLAYIGTVGWSVWISLTSSRTLPTGAFVGLAQYVRLFDTERWIISLHNVAIFGVLFILACLVLGFLLAVFIDQQVMGEGVLRTVFLYPYAMSFVATGLAWQWIMNPELGLQATLRGFGWEAFTFDWIVSQDKVIYAVVIAAVWQASGLVMALLLAGLRGIDESLWKAARIDGIPRWRYYVSIVLPMLWPAFATAIVLLAVAVVKVYDVVVAMTQGGPGTASEVPAKFIMDNLFTRANIGLASAASTVMLLTVLALAAPYLYARSRAAARREAAR